MEFTAERLEKMKDKRLKTYQYSKWLERYHYGHDGKRGIKDPLRLEPFERMQECINVWQWNKYEENKLLDLKKVNRCKSRYCPNCRAVALSRNILEFSPKFLELARNGYTPYLLTLTVPNCGNDNLRLTIDQMQKAWSKFWEWFFKPIDGRKGYKDRLFNSVGAIRFLEINIKDYDKLGQPISPDRRCHPHYHLLIFLDGKENEADFIKHIPGEWSYKYNQQNMLSHVDVQIREMWYKAFNKIKANADIDDSYICDIRPLENEKGIYEVFKYCFKDSDIKTFNDFKLIYETLYNKRLRQGYGELYDLELSEEGIETEKEDTLEQYLLANKDELPQKWLTHFNQLLSKEYHVYKKISRFAESNISEIIDNLG